MANYQLNIPVSFNQLVDLVQRLPQKEKTKLVRILEEDKVPSREQILSELKADYIALKNGTLKTRPVEELFEELKNEGYL